MNPYLYIDTAGEVWTSDAEPSLGERSAIDAGALKCIRWNPLSTDFQQYIVNHETSDSRETLDT